MVDDQPSDEVTDAIAHIEMERQAALQDSSPAVAGQRAMQRLQALYETEAKTPKSEERPASMHAANLAAVQDAIARLKSRMRGGGGGQPGATGGGGMGRNQQRPDRRDGQGQPHAGPRQQRQGGQHQRQGQRQYHQGQPAGPGQQQQPSQHAAHGQPAAPGQPQQRPPGQSPSKRRGRRPPGRGGGRREQP